MFNLISDKKTEQTFDERQLKKSIDYAKKYWRQITRIHIDSSDTLLGLPYPYIVPSDQHGNFKFNEQYYWDSYFIALGLIDCGENSMAEGMLENLFYMFKKFNMIPSASRLYMTSRSQPPLLTSFIKLIYYTNVKSTDWLKQAVQLAQEEYLNVWMGETHPHWRQVYRGLSRYYDVNVLHDLAEAESGWDMTSRFGRKALDYLPIDLNCLLYKYECDFAEIAGLLDDHQAVSMWQDRAHRRQAIVNELMWNKLSGFYYDYNYNKEVKSTVWSLAAYYTLWSGLANPEQANALVKNLRRFECAGGLAATSHNLIDMSIFGSLKTQWTYPNGWAPLHLIVVDGLENYGYSQQATRIAKLWLKTNLKWFIKHGEFLEKYNVVDTFKPPVSGVYPTQVGFGWTNAVYICLANRYLKIKIG